MYDWDLILRSSNMWHRWKQRLASGFHMAYFKYTNVLSRVCTSGVCWNESIQRLSSTSFVAYAYACIYIHIYICICIIHSCIYIRTHMYMYYPCVSDICWHVRYLLIYGSIQRIRIASHVMLSWYTGDLFRHTPYIWLVLPHIRTRCLLTWINSTALSFLPRHAQSSEQNRVNPPNSPSLTVRAYVEITRCMCVYVSVCIFVYVCVYICVHPANLPSRMVRVLCDSQVREYACVCVCMFLYTCICTCVYVCICVYMSKSSRVSPFVLLFVLQQLSMIRQLIDGRVELKTASTRVKKDALELCVS